MLRGQPKMSSKRLFSLQFRQVPAFCAVLALWTPLPAFAWGPEGHEIVALMAMRELTPAARAQVTRLLGSPTMMVHDASWADEVRDRRPGTGPWHYVDIPLEASGYVRSRD